MTYNRCKAHLLIIWKILKGKTLEQIKDELEDELIAKTLELKRLEIVNKQLKERLDRSTIANDKIV